MRDNEHACSCHEVSTVQIKGHSEEVHNTPGGSLGTQVIDRNEAMGERGSLEALKH